MFERVGEKLKIVASVLFFVGAIASVLVGLSFLADDNTVFTGIFVMIGGILGSYIVSLLLAALGELACSAQAREAYLEMITYKVNALEGKENNSGTQSP